MSNKSDGNRFEREFCEALAQKGFWAHNFAQSPSGQPADVIAVKGKTSWLIDCKLTAKGSFELSRVEPNQLTAMDAWTLKSEYEPYFAIKRPNGIIQMLGYSQVQAWLADGISRVSEEVLMRHSITLDMWINGVNRL